jgi:opacity protein-like surface antigen
MRRRSAVVLITTLAVLSAGASSAAAAEQASQPQRPRTAPGPAAARLRPGFGVFATFDRISFDATQTFEAVIGKSQLTSAGAAIEATNLVSRVFARVAFSRQSADGERVFIIDNTPLPLGIPLRVEMTPIEIAAGWRQPLGRGARLAAYGGAGFLLLGYQETSDFGDDGDNSDERFTGYLVLGGVDVNVFKGLTGGVEVQYRSVADAIGDAGVSKVFGETNLGGVVVRVLFGFRR